MGRSKTLKLPPDKEAPEPGEASSFPGVHLADHPIFLLVYFHKALRDELAELHRIAVAALDNSETQSSLAKDLVQEFLQRFKFLKLVYKYHCTAEDEIIFLALDEHIKNVARTYSLEHDNIDSLFVSVTRSFDVLTEEKESNSNFKTFQELVLYISTIQRSICQHMRKEEEQVFPLLIGKFSTKQQASLMWQFICSVPIILMGELLPWMISFLSPLEQIDVRNCIESIVPEEKLLKEVLTSWLGSNNHQNSGTWFKIAEGALYPDGSVNVQAILKLDSSKSYSGEHWHWKGAYRSEMTVVDKPIKGFLLWHGAMREDLNHIQKELYQIRRSRNFMSLASVVFQMKFLADVFFFYSDALEKIFYPVLNEVTDCLMSSSDKHFLDKGQLEGLLRLLHHTSHNEVASVKHVEKLCQEVDSFVIGVGKHFAFQEAKVLPILITNCSEELQKRLVYMSLQMMPLGLLQCAVTWFSAHLSEDESKHFLFTIKKENSSFNGSFSSLIHKWFLFGNRGKASIEKCRTVLHDMVKSSCCFLFKKNEEHIGSSSLNSSISVQPSPKSNPTLMEPMSANKKGKKYVSSSSFSGSHTMSETSYSGGLNLHISFPATKKSYPLHNIPNKKTCATSILNDPKPVDIIFYFHKALKKDLENLVFISSQLVGNIGLLGDFSRRFQLIWFLYRIHTETEDEIAFPALEAKGKSPNISLSYTMDHKLQDKYFDGISSIVDEMSALHASISTADVNTFSDRMLSHSELCMKLHEMCKSMHKILLDHVHLEDIELWPLFREDFTIEEQEKIIGSMLGRTGAKTLQDMIPWLMEALTPEEQHNMMFLWREATRNTMFGEWLAEWWEGYDLAKEVDEPNTCPSQTEADPFHIISAYLSKGGTLEDKDMNFPENNSTSTNIEPFGKGTVDDKWLLDDDDHHDCKECTKLFSTDISSKVADITDHVNEPGEVSAKFSLDERLQPMSQKDLEAAIHRVSHDSSLDTKQKSFLMQNLLMSRWMATQKRSDSEDVVLCHEEEIQGKFPSYQDNLKVNLGCKHYKRNCKLLAACCKKLYTCIRCHDEVADHTLDRKSITQMMCMKCLVVQPIGPSCSTTSCNRLSMARYYCSICKIFQDERKEIYHCPYCNLCRLGKGLGIDYFHCMNCNACMSRSLSVHPCRQKCFEDNCPICHEFIFTSRDPVKALPCGHMMHSKCFQAYTCNHYTCPICSKSLGDMQVYFSMLDALLAEEKMPDEYSSKTQAILCNDCEKRGTARYHWLHHKCSYCGSYNTRVL